MLTQEELRQLNAIKTDMPQNCISCGKDMWPSRSGKIYCSNECKRGRRVYITGTLYRKVVQACAETGETPSMAINDAVKAYLAEKDALNG